MIGIFFIFSLLIKPDEKYMFENEIKFINDFTLNKVKDLGSFITVEKLLSTDIHPSIKKYIEGEINYLIFEDRKKLIENSLFDYSGKEISHYFDLIANEIKKTKKISYEDVKNIILQAVSFNANYVVRPKWSLSKLIFGNNKSVSVNELQLMLSYTYYYEYLNNVFLAYLAKKKIMNISVTEFELIMNKIDRELFMLHQSKLVDNALFAIADYFSIGGLNKSSVAVEAVEIFFKEKNLTELLFKLKRNYSSSSKKKADIDDIRKVLYSTLSVDSPFVEEADNDETTIDEKHFENPLKEEFVPDKIADDLPDDAEESAEFDLNKSDSSEVFAVEESTTAGGEEILETNFDIEEKENSNKYIQDPEPEISTIKEDSSSAPISDTVDENENIKLISDLNILKDSEISADNMIPADPNETEPDIKTTDEENVLASLTAEISNDKDDEIIILDEKEEEDLLNFYDNELEISIDDDMNDSSNKNSKLNIDSNVDSELDNLELEHELPINDDTDEAVPLEQIDFVKDLAGRRLRIQMRTMAILKNHTYQKKSMIFLVIFLKKKSIG